LCSSFVFSCFLKIIVIEDFPYTIYLASVFWYTFAYIWLLWLCLLPRKMIFSLWSYWLFYIFCLCGTNAVPGDQKKWERLTFCASLTHKFDICCLWPFRLKLLLNIALTASDLNFLISCWVEISVLNNIWYWCIRCIELFRMIMCFCELWTSNLLFIQFSFWD